MRYRLLALLPLVGVPLLAVGAATSADAQTAPSLEVSSGTLVDHGAAVEVTVTLTCEAGYTAFGSVAVTDRSGNDLAEAYSGLLSVVCTGEPQDIPLVLTTQGARFHVGIALARAAFTLTLCTPNCQSVSVSEDIWISPATPDVAGLEPPPGLAAR
jgi:hypothetical protein